MVAEEGAKLSCYSVNHGAGRRMSRTASNATVFIPQEAAALSSRSNQRSKPSTSKSWNAAPA